MEMGMDKSSENSMMKKLIKGVKMYKISHRGIESSNWNLFSTLTTDNVSRQGLYFSIWVLISKRKFRFWILWHKILEEEKIIEPLEILYWKLKMDLDSQEITKSED